MADVNHESSLHDVRPKPGCALQHSPQVDLGHTTLFHAHFGMAGPPLQRCRLLLGDEAIGLTDDDIDAIRRHAQAMAQTLVEVFLHQQHAERE